MNALFELLLAFGAGSIALGSLASWLPGRLRRIGTALLGLGLVANLGAVAARWFIAGRPPVIGTYENTLVAATLIVATALYAAFMSPRNSRLSLPGLLAPWALVVLAAGSFVGRTPLPIDAGGRTLIGYAHAFVGWLDFAVLVGALAAAIGLLLHRNTDTSSAWDEALSRFLGTGFALLTATMVSGSIYSFILFGEWYRWQIVETASAVAWLAFASLLHLRLLHRWSGRRLAWATLVAFLLALPAFWVWAIYPSTYHYFDSILRVR